MTYAICSGYFQRFHEGHYTYINSAKKDVDNVIVIVNNDKQQKEKYKSFNQDIVMPSSLIVAQIRVRFPDAIVITSIDTDKSVCKTLRLLRQLFFNDKLIFVKDADRNATNIPETSILLQNNIEFKQLNNNKVNSSSSLMKL